MRVIFILLALLFMVGCGDDPYGLKKNCKEIEVPIEEYTTWRTFIFSGHDGMLAHEGTVTYKVPAHVDKKLVCDR